MEKTEEGEDLGKHGWSKIGERKSNEMRNMTESNYDVQNGKMAFS